VIVLKLTAAEAQALYMLATRMPVEQSLVGRWRSAGERALQKFRKAREDADLGAAWGQVNDHVAPDDVDAYAEKGK
jgi:hypothetical protein